MIRFLYTVLLMTMLGSAVHSAVTTIVDNGPKDNRVDILYISEGYTQSELQNFAPTVQAAIDYRNDNIRAEPYNRYKKFVNFHRIDVASPQSGISIVPSNGQSCQGSTVNNLFGGKGDCDRLGTVTRSLVNNFINDEFGGLGWTPDWTHVVLNTSQYFNSGGSGLCVFSRNYYDEIALHEGGHAFHGLADEYNGTNTSFRCANNINMASSQADAQTKWGHWMGVRQSGFRGQQSTVTIGAVQGGCYMNSGAYRPTPNSKMNLVPDPFNLPSIEKIILDIYDIVDPVDAHTANTQTLVDPATLSVTVIDPAVIKVDWYVDNQLVAQDGGEIFDLSAVGFQNGTYQITAHAYDEVVIHANSDDNNPHPLDWVRRNLDGLQQDVNWTVQVNGVINSTADFINPRLRWSSVSRNLWEYRPFKGEKVSLSVFSLKGENLEPSISRSGDHLFLVDLSQSSYRGVAFIQAREGQRTHRKKIMVH